MGKHKSEARREKAKERLIAKFGDNARFNTGTGVLSATTTVPLWQQPERPSCSGNCAATTSQWQDTTRPLQNPSLRWIASKLS
jgi:hypothetical protein